MSARSQRQPCGSGPGIGARDGELRRGRRHDQHHDADALVVLALALPAAALSAVEGAPNPCTLVPAATVSTYMGASAKPILERANNGVRVCSYWAAATNGVTADRSRLTVGVREGEPYRGQPPGTVVKTRPGLGENGEFSYNTQKRHRFAHVAGIVVVKRKSFSWPVVGPVPT